MNRPQKEVVLIGAPTDIGAGQRGASMGPEALRVAGLTASLQRLGCTVHDRGNISGPGNPDAPRVDGYRHLAEVTAWCSAIRDRVAASLANDEIPILMGGDHCVAIGSIAAVAQHCRTRNQPLSVLWLDAHADFNTAETSPTGNLHGMPVSVLTGRGPAALTGLAGTVPIVPAERIVQVGIRSVDAVEKQLVVESGLTVFDMRQVDELSMRVVMERALALAARGGAHVHVSFDVDFLDPQIAPGVPTTVPGGPSYREAQLCMEMIHDAGLLGSLDVTELNPAFDLRNQTAELAVELIESLFGEQILARAGGGAPRYTL